jgi:hypothetical protein
MSGYFAQLMQQTGLVGAAVPPGLAATALQPLSEAGNGDAPAALDVDTIQTVTAVEPPPVERPEVGRAIAPDLAQPFPQPNLLPPEAANPLEPLGNTTELIEFNHPPMPSPPSPLEELASMQRTGTDSASADSGPPTLPTEPAPARPAWALPPPSPPAGLGQAAPVEASLPQLAPPQPAAPPRQQVDLQAVWDWVAGNPPASATQPAPELGQDLGLDHGAIAPWSVSPSSDIEEPTAFTAVPSSVIPSPTAVSAPPTQDFHLSIGSITVSLEAPSPPSPPAAPLPPPAPPAADPAHLDRHYLRL